MLPKEFDYMLDDYVSTICIADEVGYELCNCEACQYVINNTPNGWKKIEAEVF